MPSRVPAPVSPLEFFPALIAIGGIKHGFIGRIPGIDVVTDREQALERLDSAHRRLRKQLGLAERIFVTAEQVHGNRVAIIDRVPESEECLRGADGLITNQPEVSLGIYVADCCAVFLVDPVQVEHWPGPLWAQRHRAGNRAASDCGDARTFRNGTARFSGAVEPVDSAAALRSRLHC